MLETDGAGAKVEGSGSEHARLVVSYQGRVVVQGRFEVLAVVRVDFGVPGGKNL